MRHRWPADTQFTRLVLEVEEESCAVCGRKLHVCDHRPHRIFTLQGPLELICKLAHCSDRGCSAHSKTISPYAETTLTLPWWLLGWDVFCWMGQRRFARHWSVPQIRAELADSYQILLSADAIEDSLRRYQTMLAARQQDPQALAAAYRNVTGLVLSIDGLQPEKGHETLYVVRDVRGKRIWFAEALLSSTADEVRRLLQRARDWAARLGLAVQLWLSDKQDAFVQGIAAEFPGVPHRYCANHFLRDLAKPMLDADSHAKVQMRSKVRGLRTIERAVLEQRQSAAVEPSAPPASAVEMPAAPPANAGSGAAAPPADGSDVVLDYCSAVRGILNDDQGGPLQPPGLRMAAALEEVRASLERNLDAKRPGPAHGQLQRLAGCIDRGLAVVQDEQAVVRQQVQEVQRVAATLEVANGAVAERQAEFGRLQKEFAGQKTPFYQHLAAVMASFLSGLFAGGEAWASLQDNLDLERWFRQPKGHERRIHGHKHAGVRIVQEGPTLLLALDAHVAHPQPFTAEDLSPYQDATAPACQAEAIHRRKVMRKARSKKNESSCSTNWNVGT
jgi:GNAT superfamily N-acetyltransferase